MSKTQIPTGGITADAINGTLIADDAINSEHYTDGSIDTAHIGDNQVTAAKATGVGGLALVGSSESSSSAAAVTFDNVFSSTYRAYKIIGMIAPSTSTTVKWRFRSGGSDVNSSHYSKAERSMHVDSSNNVDFQNSVATNASTHGTLGGAGCDSDSNNDFVGFDITIYDPNTDVFGKPVVTGLNTYRNAGSNKIYISYLGTIMDTNPNADGIKFETDSGTLLFHSIRVYGIVNS